MSNTPEYVKLDTGDQTTADDPERGLWYGQCGYWTDNWSKLVLMGPGIPCCPGCGSPGFQITAREWFDGVKKYEDAGNAGYAVQVEAQRDTCPRAKLRERHD